jgi:asparagine synthase (glutamine-hydrolysing)
MRAGNLFNKLEKVTPLEHRAFLARGFDDFHGHLRTLLRTNDKMGMSVSIEPRVPFLSNQLIDFGLHLNLQSKYNQKKTKYIVKQLGEKKLPHDIVHAKKIGFGYNDEMWSNTVGFLRGGLVPDLFKWGASEAEKIFDDLEANSGILHTLVSIELWAQIYLNHESTDALSDKLLRNVA